MNDLEDLVEQVLLWLRILYKFGSQTIHRPSKRNLGGSFYKQKKSLGIMTRAVTIAELGDQNVFTVDGTNNRVGIGSTQPTVKLDVGGVVVATAFTGDGTGLTGVASTDNIITGTAATFTGGVTVSGGTTISGASNVNVTGVITATKFVGDGSELTGVSGFATALSSDTTSILSSIFKTPRTLTVGTGVSVTVASDTASGNIAFMREKDIHVGAGSTFHVGSGTTLITNVLTIF